MPSATDTIQQPPPLRVSRRFPAPRALVFKAWSSADHVKRWFSPEVYTVPDARVQMEVGGPFEVCMRSPTGQEHWSRGTFVEVTPHSRLVIDMHAADDAGRALFRAYTEVNFSDAEGGALMEVVQTYTFLEPAMAAPMVAGAAMGWKQTLDKLEKEVAHIQTAAPERSVVHATFHLERTYDAPAARVWRALSEPAAKDKWFGGSPKRWELLERRMDVRVGGHERLKVRWESGMISTFDALYHDVIPQERLVYTYEMHQDDRKISVSLATMQVKAEGARTRLLVTEQGAFLDGYDDAGSREHGTGFLLDALGTSLGD